jgi:hypothetical protein
MLNSVAPGPEGAAIGSIRERNRHEPNPLGSIVPYRREILLCFTEFP